MRKNFIFSMAIAVVAFFQAPQLNAQENCIVQIEEGAGNMTVTGISDNGRYVVGIEHPVTGYIWDTVTGQIVHLPDIGQISALWDVTNDGIAVGGYNYPITFKVDDWNEKIGTWTALPQIQEETLGEAEIISPDGEIIGGWTIGEKNISVPCLWKKNGEMTVLDSPLVDDTDRAPQRVHMTAMSLDASVMTGFMTSYKGTYELGLLWRAPEYKCEVFFMDSLITKDGNWNDYTMMVSDNGKWLGGNIRYYDDSKEITSIYVYRYNLETDVMEKLDDIMMEGTDGGVTAIDNNGTLYITSPAGNPWARTAYIARVNEPTCTLEDFLKEKYDNTDISDAMYFSGSIFGTSPDGKILAGHGASLDEESEAFDFYYAYVIRMDEATGISCKKITNSSLRCYAANGELRLIGNPSVVELTDMAGATVRQMEVNGNTVSLAGLPAGIYAAKLSNGNEVNVQKVVVK